MYLVYSVFRLYFIAATTKDVSPHNLPFEKRIDGVILLWIGLSRIGIGYK